MKLASFKRAFTPRRFILLTVLRRWSRCFSLTRCCFVVHSTRRFVLILALCYFVLVFFSPFSIMITSLGEERVNLSALRTFVRFAFVWVWLFFLLVSVKGCDLWLWHSLDFSHTFLVVVRFWVMSCFLLFVVLLLLWVDSVSYCDHLFGEERADCLACLFVCGLCVVCYVVCSFLAV